MRFWLSGPRILGIRPGVSFSPGDLRAKQKQPIPASTPKRDPPVSYIYVISGEHNMVKIGITTNPKARLAALKTSSAFPISYAFIGSVSGKAIDIEKEAHSLLSHHSCNGEWFDVAPELAVSAVMGATAKLGQSLRPVSLDAIPGGAAAAVLPPQQSDDAARGLRILRDLIMTFIVGGGIAAWIVYELTDSGPVTMIVILMSLVVYCGAIYLAIQWGKRQ